MNKLFSLEGKVALVTGGAYGIGFAMAESLAGAGAKIAFNCRSQANLDKPWPITPPRASRPTAASLMSPTRDRSAA